MKKKLLAILLCLVMTVGILPTEVIAEAEEDSRFPVVRFTIVKKVEKAENAAEPPAETFEFELEDTEEVEKKSPVTYGIELQGDLKIETVGGVNVYEKTVEARIDMSHVNPNGDWETVTPAGGGDPSSYYKTFLITEKNDGKDGWSYSTAKYAVTFKYDCGAQNMSCGVYEVGNDVSFRTADFTNTYTKQASVAKTVEIPFTVTVKQGGNVAPGKQSFELEVFDNDNLNAEEYSDVTCTASVETDGVNDYKGEMVITGPEDQVWAFTCEGFYVREKNTKVANWEYSDAVWYVTPDNNAGYDIYPTELQITDNGSDYEPDWENAAESLIFVNTYTENKTVTPEAPKEPASPDESKASEVPENTEKPTRSEDSGSPQTGDSSTVGLWIALLFISGGAVTGATLYSRKKKIEE